MNAERAVRAADRTYLILHAVDICISTENNARACSLIWQSGRVGTGVDRASEARRRAYHRTRSHTQRIQKRASGSARAVCTYLLYSSSM